MKIAIKVLISLALVGQILFCQLKDKKESLNSITSSLIRSDGGGLLFGWLNPNKLLIRNSYTLSYTSGGGNSFSLGTLTSSFMYQISDPLFIVLDLSLVHSPYNNLGSDFSRNVTGLYLTRAQLNYQPSDNVLLQLQFRQFPTSYWLNDYYFETFSPFHKVQKEEGN